MKGASSFRKMHIGWDLDDVTTNLTEKLLESYNLEYGHEAVLEEVRGWDFFPEEIHEKMRESGYPGLGAKPESVEALRALKARGDRVSIITYRSPDYREQTAAWLREHLRGLYDGLYMTGGGKAETCRTLGVDVLLDDSLRQAVQVSRSGVHAILLRTPMNRCAESTGLIHVAEDFGEVLGWIEFLRNGGLCSES